MFERDKDGLLAFAQAKCLKEHGKQLNEQFIEHSPQWLQYVRRCAVDLTLQSAWPSQRKDHPQA
jgi:hypothetical protein